MDVDSLPRTLGQVGPGFDREEPSSKRIAMRKKEAFFKSVRRQKRENQRDRREVGGVRAVLLSMAEETFFKRRGQRFQRIVVNEQYMALCFHNNQLQSPINIVCMLMQMFLSLKSGGKRRKNGETAQWFADFLADGATFPVLGGGYSVWVVFVCGRGQRDAGSATQGHCHGAGVEASTDEQGAL